MYSTMRDIYRNKKKKEKENCKKLSQSFQSKNIKFNDINFKELIKTKRFKSINQNHKRYASSRVRDISFDFHNSSRGI